MQIHYAKIFTVFVVILMTTSIMMLTIPTVKAQENIPHGGVAPANGYIGPTTQPSNAPANTLQVQTYPYLSITPNPTGVNQYVLINMWITPPPTNQRFLIGFTIIITKPDGTNDTLGPYNSYMADGTSWLQYTVDQVGNYTYTFNFAGEYFAAGYYNAGVLSATTSPGAVLYQAMYYTPATVTVKNVQVINQQVLSWPPSPLPTGYWTRPISPENREWYAISGSYPWPFMNWCQDWLGPYITAPNSSHIVWNKALVLGGIIGGDIGPVTQTTAPGYPWVIYDGRGYQTWNKPGVGSVSACYDIRTGEVFYEIPGGAAPAMLSEVAAFTDTIGAYHPASYELIAGTVPASSSGHRQTLSQLIKIDPFTGLTTLNVTGMVGDFYNGQFVLSVQNLGTTTNPIYRLINWTTSGSATDFSTRVISNVSTTMTSIPQLIDWNTGVGVVVNRFGEGLIFGGNPLAYNLKTGQVIWNITTGTQTPYGGGGQGAASMDNGLVFIQMENGFWNAYNELTGTLVWTSPNTATASPWGEFWSYSAASYQGLLITDSYVGCIAYNETDGKIVWQTASYAVPYETPYGGEYSWHSASIVADGKFYSYTDEHTPTQPLTRGWKWFCMNATTGEVIWSIQGFNSDSRNFGGSIADGYLAASDQYSGTMRVFGKGLSATTVTAPDLVIQQGNGIVIEGTVLDMSPAQPNTPCVSKDSMSTQMEYLHMGMPIAGIWSNETISGVPVTLQAISSNNSVIDIGTTTTNGYYGTFGYTWIPPAAGQYTIVASFAGDDSYGSSGAATTVSVGPAPTTAPTTTPTTAPSNLATTTDLMTYLIVGVIVILIAIAIVGVLLMRKH